MKVYRLCNESEIESILTNKDFKNAGHNCNNNPHKNTHQYIQGKKYLHFFKKKNSLLYI